MYIKYWLGKNGHALRRKCRLSRRHAAASAMWGLLAFFRGGYSDMRTVLYNKTIF